MEQADLIREARNLLNQADEKRIAGEHDQADIRLDELRVMLTRELCEEAPESPEQTPAETPAEE